MQLKTLIKKLEKAHKDFVDKHGKEPKISGVEDNWDENNFVLDLYGSKKRNGFATEYSNSSSVKIRY